MIVNNNFRDSFEEKYVGFYRWLLLLVGCLSFIGFIAMILSLIWTASDTSREQAYDYFDSPQWLEVRREVLPLVVKAKEDEVVEAVVEKSSISVHPLVLEIRDNLLLQFDANEQKLIGHVFSKRLLNEWLMEEIAISSSWRPRLLESLVSASAQIGSDERIKRIGSVEARADVVLESLNTYIEHYLINVRRADQLVGERLQKEESEKTALAAQIIVAIPIVVITFQSLIGLILLIRVELHLRQFVRDYRKTNL